jgi:endonuclease G
LLFFKFFTFATPFKEHITYFFTKTLFIFMQFGSIFKEIARISYMATVVAFIASCSPTTDTVTPEKNTEEQTQDSKISHLKQNYATLNEGFETGSKTSYTIGSVTLSTGSWRFDDALLGNLSGDIKSGLVSARIRNAGSLTTLFDKTGGTGTITVKHAKYGTDASSTWELWVSTNSGSTWTKVGSTITTSTTTLSSTTFTVNQTANTRIQIRKTDGTTNRLNIDDISITDYTGGTTGGTGGTSTGGGSNPSNGGTPTTSIHLAMGNPSGALASITATTNYMLEKPQYIASYHKDRGVPNWVSWYLSSAWVGSTARQDNFRPDTSLPAGWYQVTNTDYTGSGFDRGHNCPSADRTLTVTDNSATFFMTNMMPQAADNNQGPWASLENYCRTLINQGNELYIVAGSYGMGGTGLNGTFNTIAGGKITVPNRTWKVIVVLPTGTNDVARVGANTRIIAIDMPNAQGIRNNSWGTYRVSVDFIESKTGYNILSALPESVQTTVEAKVDTGATL